MKKIITLIILVLSLITTPVSAKSYTDAQLDSIFANTLAFQHRLDTAVCCFVIAASHYKTAINCYNLIKQHKMNKKDIPAVIKDISEHYEPTFAYFLDGPVLEAPYSESTFDFNTWYSTKSSNDTYSLNLCIRRLLYGF